jgi:uncharacterized membrane protein YidH (DUF202 family)
MNGYYYRVHAGPPLGSDNFKKIREKILAKIINLSVSSISMGFVSFQSTFLSIIQQEPLCRVWLSKAMTSLGDNQIAV